MEATAVSLTRTVLDGMLGSAGTAMANEAALLLGVRKEVDFIRRELQMMQSFLREQSSAACSTTGGGCCRVKDTVTTCVKQVRDLACDLEDCLLDFTVHAARARWLRWAPGLAARHRVAGRIRELKASLDELNQRNQRYNVFVADSATPAAPEDHGQHVHHEYQLTPAGNGHRDIQRGKSWLVRMLDNVGAFVADQATPSPAAAEEHGHADGEYHYQLTPGNGHEHIQRSGEMKHLADMVKREGATVVSVWGMGGMGKSSLVRMLYDDSSLIDDFDGRAWVTVPHPLDMDCITKDLERRLEKQLGVKPSDHGGVRAWLKENRCLVVVDDVSTEEEWKQLCLELGVGLGGAGSRSRVVVTTRRQDVAKLCAGEDVYKLKPLEIKEARKLFCQKVYKNADHILLDDLLDQAILILNRCRGLPLAIATIGGLLANRPKTVREWKILRQHLGSELELHGDIRRVITSSYDGLPYHLKCCFLYLSIFPENHEIRLTRLLRRWMAEGYITKPRDMSIEEVGRMYYNELISRSMIQPSEKARASMGVERCRVHGVVLQIILSKSIEENQLYIMDKHCNEAPESKIRHLVVTRWKSNTNEKMASINLSQVRSLTIFGNCPRSLISSKLRLLRVLDLEDTSDLKNDDLKHIGELYHLRYLGLRKTKISRLPSSLQNLRCLETLDVQDTKVTQLPVGITKLEKLRHLVGGVNFARDLVDNTRKNKDESKCKDNCFTPLANLVTPSSSSACKFSVTATEGIEKLRNLQVLGVVHITQGNRVARNLGKLTGLRRLGVDVDATEEVKEELCSSVEKLVHLERLEVRSESLEFLMKLTKDSPPRHLTSLRLCGRLDKLPGWISSLKDLGKVKLLQTLLKQADIDVIGRELPNLTLLALWKESFAGGSLCFNGGTFQKLKQLYIEGLENLKTIKIEKEALCELQKLEVRKCNNLDDSEKGLSRVLFLESLDELVVTSCGDKMQLEKALQRQISGFELAKRPKLITGKSIVSRT